MGTPIEKVINGWQEFLLARNSGGYKWTMGTLASRMIAGLPSSEHGTERANANALRRELRELAQAVASIPISPVVDPRTNQPWRVNEENAVALEQLIRVILDGYTPDLDLAISYLHSQLAKIANTRPGRFKSDRAISDPAHRDFIDSEAAIFDFLDDVQMVNDPMYRALANEIRGYLWDSSIGVDHAWILICRTGDFNNYTPELKFHISYHGIYDGVLDIRSGQFQWHLPAPRLLKFDVCPETPPQWTQLVLSAIEAGYAKTGISRTQGRR